MAYQRRLQQALERHPAAFFADQLPPLWEAARTALAAFVGCDDQDLVFVPNTTTGVNTVLKSLRWSSGDEILTTQHAYGACRNALDAVTERFGARVVVAEVPFPCASAAQIHAAVLARVSTRTRLAMLDHVTSLTALAFPLESLIPQLHSRGIDTLIDGAHAPGVLAVDLRALAPTYYTANCYKWLGCPKGAGFLYVSRARQHAIEPLVTGYGYNAPCGSKSRFGVAFDWPGGYDPTPYLCIPAALRFMDDVLPGPAASWEGVRAHNHAMVCAARQCIAAALQVDLPVPETLLGSMAVVRLPGTPPPNGAVDPWQRHLATLGFEVIVRSLPGAQQRYLRLSAQLYNTQQQYETLAQHLQTLDAQSRV